jgi:hypothetical protein
MNRWHSVLVDAINNRQTLVIRYKRGFADRVVEPHRYRVDGSKQMLEAWQIAGASESGDACGWKDFNVANIDFISLSGTSFDRARPGYKRSATSMGIYAQL